jgi:5-methylthioribose kinase
MTSALATLSAADLPSYLRALNVVPDDVDVTVTPLGGGVSAIVLLAQWDGRAVVVKQPRAQLAVDDEWIFDRARAFVERDCLSVLAERMPGAAPELVFVDEERFVVGMTAAPPGGVLWRDEHDRGVTDPRHTDQAARLLGRLHETTAGDAALAERFAAQWPLLEGRVAPYHRAIARRHPDLATRIEDEVARLLGTRRCLVHGDFSPKNLIAYPDRMIMLDFEVAHWGDPAFDVAFLLALILLDGISHGDSSFTEQAVRFWRHYRVEAGAAAADPSDVVAELGCIVLARVDGKSRLPHLTGTVADSARRYGRALLTDLRRASVEETLAACPS